MGGVGSGVHHTKPRPSPPPPSLRQLHRPRNPENVSDVRSESWYWKEWPVVTLIVNMENIRRFQQSMENVFAAPWNSMESIFSPLNGLTYDAWRAPRRAPCRKNICEAVARSLKMNVDGAACQDAGLGRSFPMWTFSRDAKPVHSAGEGAKKSTGNRRGEPYTTSADDAFKFSFHALRIPSRTKVEFRPYVHRHGTWGRPSAGGVASS